MPQNQPPDNWAWSQAEPPPPQLGYRGVQEPTYRSAPEPFDRAAPQMYPPTPGGPPPGQPGWMIFVIAVCAIAAVALLAGVAVILWPKQVSNSPAARPPSVTQIFETSTPPTTVGRTTTTIRTTSPTPSSTTSPATATPAAGFPAGASPCPGSGSVNGGYKESAVGSPNTSCSFAEAVRSAYGNAGVQGPSRTVNARSPVTGKDYRMTCTGSAGVVRCVGGDNAIVYLR